MTKVSIVIRTFNEEKWLRKCLSQIRRQSVSAEIIIVDSGSSDGTISIIEDEGLKALTISDYKPGKALNLGFEAAKGEFVVCLSAHCIPVNSNWLADLIAPLESAAEIVASYGRQIPLSTSSPLDKRDLFNMFGEESRLQTHDTFFHNANSCIKKSAWVDLPFDETINHVEDRIWAREILGAGHKIFYCHNAEVFHWHGVNQGADKKRCQGIIDVLSPVFNDYFFRDESIFFDTQNFHAFVALENSSEKALHRLTRLCETLREVRHNINLVALCAEANLTHPLYGLAENLGFEIFTGETNAQEKTVMELMARFYENAEFGCNADFAAFFSLRYPNRSIGNLTLCSTLF